MTYLFTCHYQSITLTNNKNFLFTNIEYKNPQNDKPIAEKSAVFLYLYVSYLVVYVFRRDWRQR
jgi:hypothetical protein